MARFQVGDEVYIKGVVDKIVNEDTNYPVRVNSLEGYGIDSFTLDGNTRQCEKERSLFHASEIQSPMREYKIGQKLNGFAEVMQALIDGEFVDVGSCFYRIINNEVAFFTGGKKWEPTSNQLNWFKSGTIAEDPTPKKMVAWDNNGHILILPPGVDVHSAYKKITKQELAAILERVE